MERKRGISTHRKSSKWKTRKKPCNGSITVVSNNDNVLNTVQEKVHTNMRHTPVSKVDVPGNHPHTFSNSNAPTDDSPYCLRSTNCLVRGRCIKPLLDDANKLSTDATSQNAANDIDHAGDLCSVKGTEVYESTDNMTRTPKKGNNGTDSTSDIESDLKNVPDGRNKPSKRCTTVQRGTKVLINNVVHCNDGVSPQNNDSGRSRDDSPVNRVIINNNIIMNQEVYHDSTDSDDSSNDFTTIKKNKLTKYSNYHTRRRSIRALIKFFKDLGNVQYQSEILSSFLNESHMAPILQAANILPPQKIIEHKLIVDQILKQIGRCSQKVSERGMINDDKDSLRTNLVAAMVASPNVNINESLLRKNHILRLICSNTDVSRSACKRLVNKAEQRRNDLSVSETVSSWSIISNRNGYNTQQSKVNKELLDWILNHHHVIRSPQETVLVKVPSPNGTKSLERVGKLLLEISVRELHQDLMKDPPIGFRGAYSTDVPKKLLISERYLRNMLPPQLKSMSFADKQLCGCSCCTITKMVHACLLKYRKRTLSQQTTLTRVRTRNNNSKSLDLEEYRMEILDTNSHKHPHPRDYLKTITCKNDSHNSLPKWKCVMGRCASCPSPVIPKLENFPDSPLGNITYGDYRYHLKCRIHGILKEGDLECKKCLECMAQKIIDSPEPLFRKKEITMIECSISQFHNHVYIPYMKKFKYHTALVTLLSKNYCKHMRTEAFKKNQNWLLSEMDYAERLAKQLDGEIQSDHFGDNASLSIEGCTLQYHGKHSKTSGSHVRIKTVLDFHSHFADYSRQDAATTFDHICRMFDNHISRHGPFSYPTIILDHTDGCAKQYRCGNALYLLSVLSISYNVIIDRAICAPGHGKSIIDGLNAVDKHYLRKVMRMSGSSRLDDIESRMRIDTTSSFAQECARLCSLNKRKI